jgi:hypothetical protein
MVSHWMMQIISQCGGIFMIGWNDLDNAQLLETIDEMNAYNEKLI